MRISTRAAAFAMIQSTRSFLQSSPHCSPTETPSLVNRSMSAFCASSKDLNGWSPTKKKSVRCFVIIGVVFCYLFFQTIHCLPVGLGRVTPESTASPFFLIGFNRGVTVAYAIPVASTISCVVSPSIEFSKAFKMIFSILVAGSPSIDCAASCDVCGSVVRA